LNSLRFKPDSALKYRVPLSQTELPAVRAALSQEGVFAGRDYRGVLVYAAIRTIPDSPWAIITKIDRQEILEPVSSRIRYVVGTCLLIVLATIMALSLWWRGKQEAYLRTRYESELKFNQELKQAEQSLQEANNRLEERVALRTEEISESNNKLKQEIAERKQIEEKLFQSRKLETIGQIASGVAHEVRNPLNAILSITEALFRENEIENNPEFTPYIQHIRTQVNRLANLMNDLLELGKPISAANLQALPLEALCHETVELWKQSGMAKNRQVSICAGHDTAATLVTADSIKLQQVIFNLLENAGDHTPSEGTITLHIAATEQASGMAIVQITDQGKGIPEVNLSRVFEPFYSDRQGGTGLGLSLVKHFLENMGGTVHIRNNDPPPGCTAELHIPLSMKEQP
jgi:signal transduction histidine kinase